MTDFFRPLDEAIAAGVVPAADRGPILDALQAVPEERRAKTLDDIIESHVRARKYLENVRGLIKDKAVRRTTEPETRSVPPTEQRRPKRSRSEKYAEDMLNFEREVERKLNPDALSAVFKNSPKELRANVRRLLDRVIRDIEKAKEALK